MCRSQSKNYRAYNISFQVKDQNLDSDELGESYFPESLVQDFEDLTYTRNSEKPMDFEDLLNSPGFSNIINTPAKATVEEVLCMILKFGLFHKLPVSAVSKLMSLINGIFEKPVLPFESRYMIDKFFNHNDNSEFHVTCSNCKHYVGKLENIDESIKCKKCQTDCETNPSSDNLMVLMDPRKTIKNLIESNQDYYDKVIKKNPDERTTIKDIHDGSLYKEFVKSLPPEERTSYTTGNNFFFSFYHCC